MNNSVKKLKYKNDKYLNYDLDCKMYNGEYMISYDEWYENKYYKYNNICETKSLCNYALCFFIRNKVVPK